MFLIFIILTSEICNFKIKYLKTILNWNENDMRIKVKWKLKSRMEKNYRNGLSYYLALAISLCYLEFLACREYGLFKITFWFWAVRIKNALRNHDDRFRSIALFIFIFIVFLPTVFHETIICLIMKAVFLFYVILVQCSSPLSRDFDVTIFNYMFNSQMKKRCWCQAICILAHASWVKRRQENMPKIVVITLYLNVRYKSCP